MKASEDPRWTALAKKRQEALLEKNRDTYTDHDWWDSTYENFIEKMRENGIKIDTRSCRGPRGSYEEPRIYFSGFYCQGSSASFEGHVSDWGKFLEVLGKPELIGYANDFGWRFSSGTYGRGSNMDCSGEFTVDDNPFDEDENPLQHSAWGIHHALVQPDKLDALEEDCKEQFSSFAGDLYRDLQEEYEYLTSDEVVIESLLANFEDDELRGEPDDEDTENEDHSSFQIESTS